MVKEKIASSLFYDDAEDFIPICCHYNDHTLLTKNGELIQTVSIKGIGLHPSARHLDQLRQDVRSSLIKNLGSADVSCWIHTSRRRGNLDDNLEYPTKASSHIHHSWVKKNYWHDKYLSTLYISFVYKAKDIKISDYKSLMMRLKISEFTAEHDAYLQESAEKLDSIVSGFVDNLKEYYPTRLGIYFLGDIAYCGILSLLYGILRGIEKPIKLEEKNLSKILGNFRYGIGLDKIEIIVDDIRKYAAFISLKEYYELSSKALEEIIQTPTEFVITEAFYFVDPKIAKDSVKYQKYISDISYDKSIIKSKKIDTLMASSENYPLPYCNHQISIMLLDSHLEKLDKNISMIASKFLKMGLLIAREDTRIEHALWSQIPGNLKYLKRLVTSPVSHIAAFATLHNTNSGLNDVGWGYYISLLRTETGTPFFFNFHGSKTSAKSLIVGVPESGKTCATNFLVSEAMKYDPAILYITFSKDSYVFININDGKWIESPFNVDFLKIPSVRDNRVIIKAFLTAMSGDDVTPLSEEEESEMNSLIDFLFTTSPQERSFQLIAQYDFTQGEHASSLKSKMSQYLEGGEYYQYFIDDGRWENEASQIMAIDFSILSDEIFEQTHYPSQDRMLPEYERKFSLFKTFREIIISSNILKGRDYLQDRYKKLIIKNENLIQSFTTKLGYEYYQEYFKCFDDYTMIYLSECTFSETNKIFDSDIWQKIQELFDTKIYLGAELVRETWKAKLLLDEHELQKLKYAIVASRLFLIKQEGEESILCELSLGGFTEMLNLFSADAKIIDQYNKFGGVLKESTQDEFLKLYESLK